MSLESRTRITLQLPAPATADQNLLVDAILADLIQLCGGVTATSSSPSVVDGWWLDIHNVPVRDTNMLVLADAPLPPDDVDLLAFLDKLKLRCQREFSQDIIWVSVHRVERVSTDDFKK